MRYIFAFFVAFLLAGCFADSPQPDDGMIYKPNNDKNSKLMFERVLKVPVDCSSGAKKGSDVVIDGARYSSDVALNNCLKRNLIDAGMTLKKVYIHRITDNRKDASVLSYMNNEGLNTIYTPSFSLEELYYLFLQDELKSRGILVLDEPSPSSIRLDFDIRHLAGARHPSNGTLELAMGAKLSLNGSRVNRKRDIISSAKVVKCGINCDLDFFTSLIIKQAAIKSAQQISDINR